MSKLKDRMGKKKEFLTFPTLPVKQMVNEEDNTAETETGLGK